MVTPYTSQEQFDHVFPVAPVAAQPQCDPWCWCIDSENSADWCFSANRDGVLSNAAFMDADCVRSDPFPLYTHPIAQPAVPVTDAEVHLAEDAYCDGEFPCMRAALESFLESRGQS